MPDITYLDNTHSILSSYNVVVPFNKWLRGADARQSGFMFIAAENKLDIFGFLLKTAGYTESNFAAYRVPSQFAQIVNPSNRLLPRCASFLTTPGHADTDDCVKLGIINDDVTIDDNKRQQQIAEILKRNAIAVRFCEAVVEKWGTYTSVIQTNSRLINTVVAEGSSLAALAHEILLAYVQPMKDSGYSLLYGDFMDKTIVVLYNGECVADFIVEKDNVFLTILKAYTGNFLVQNLDWFKLSANVRRLTASARELVKADSISKKVTRASSVVTRPSLERTYHDIVAPTSTRRRSRLSIDNDEF